MELLDKVRRLKKVEDEIDSLENEKENLLNDKDSTFTTYGFEFLQEFKKQVEKRGIKIRLIQLDSNVGLPVGKNSGALTVKGVQQYLKEYDPQKTRMFEFHVILDKTNEEYGYYESLNLSTPFDVDLRLNNGKTMREYLDTEKADDGLSGVYTKLLINQDCIKYFPLSVLVEDFERCGYESTVSKILEETIQNIHDRREKQTKEIEKLHKEYVKEQEM